MAYPSSLPVFAADSYSYTDADEMSTAAMEAGQDRRRRTTRGSDTVFTVQTVMTSEQLAIFEAWYESEAGHGTAWFGIDLIVGIGSMPHVARFVGHYSTQKSGPRAWVVSAMIETAEKRCLPTEGLEAALSNTVGIVSAVISLGGDELTIIYNKDVMRGPSYIDSDFDIDVSGGASNIGISYLSGDGTQTHVYSISAPIRYGDACSLDFTGDADSIISPGGYLGLVSDFPIINNSISVSTGPSILSATIDPSGSLLTVVFSGPMTQGSEYSDSDFVLSGIETGDGVGGLYVDGDGTDTWEFWLFSWIHAGDTVTLDYVGGDGGVVPLGGGDEFLQPFSSFGVQNTADYSDIQLFSTFSGEIIDSLYTASPTDYPASHVASVGPGITVDSQDYPGRLDFDNTQSSYVDANFQVSRQAGRVGFWYRKTASGAVLTLSNSSLGTQDYLQIRKGSENPSTLSVFFRYNGVDVINESHITPFLIPDTVSSYRYIEVLWDFETFGVAVFVSGELVREYQTTGDYAGAYDTLTLGSFASQVTATCTYDNVAITSDPYRDLLTFISSMISPRQ